jgi:glycosidase
MKKVLLSALLLFVSMALSAQVKIQKIEPTDWFVGMKNPTLQLMVYGPGIGTADVTTSFPGVKVTQVVHLDSPNYLLVYLDLSAAQPGTMKLDFTNNGKKKSVGYTLKSRTVSGKDREGFSSSDVLYMLMPDRFANGKPDNDQLKGMQKYKVDRNEPSLRHGGDLEGIRQHLDYFNQLGVTALWFTPVLENNSPDEGKYSTYHGYATTDYYRVDPRFGTNDEYRRLVAEAHQHGLKVVMDMIFNHCGSYHPWLKDMPSKDWFNQPDYQNHYLQTSYKLTPIVDPYASRVDKKETVEGWFVKGMPDLNQNNPHVMRYLIQNSEWWIETVGIDGIRMDTYPYAYFDGMAEWMRTLNEEYPNFNVVGETWVTEPAYTARWQKDSRLADKNSNLKTVMDFSFYDKINKAKKQETDSWFDGLNLIYNNFVYDYLYPNPSSVMAFIENHDTDRFLGDGKDVKMLKQALALLLTTRRIPQLYYGTEVLMGGTKAVTDGDVRKDFIGGFPGDTRSAFTAEGRTAEENDMFNWLSKVLHWRQGNQAVTKGTMIQFIPQNGIYVYGREYQGSHVLVLLNGTTKPASADMSRYAEVIGDNDSATDIVTGKRCPLKGNLSLTPRESLILEY